MPKPKPKRKTAIERAIELLEAEMQHAIKTVEGLNRSQDEKLFWVYSAFADAYKSSIRILREEAKRGR